jgi:hypothetical protein
VGLLLEDRDALARQGALELSREEASRHPAAEDRYVELRGCHEGISSAPCADRSLARSLNRGANGHEHTTSQR